MYQIAVFVSGGGTNLQAIIDQIDQGRLAGVRIACVIASKADCPALARARRAGLATDVVPRKQFVQLADFDRALLAVLARKEIDLVVLAGFLSLLGKDFLAAYPDRVINIHPSLLPAFSGPGFYGLKPHQEALAYGVRLSGATVHLVDPTYDTGPVVLQKAVAVKQTDTAQDLQERIMREAEQVILPEAIALFAAGRICVQGRRVFIEEENGL